VDEQILETAAPQRPQRDMRWVFIGADGLRAGWSALLFVLLYLIFALLSGMLFARLLAGLRTNDLSLSLGLKMELVQLLPAVIATIVMALIEGRSPLAYGFQGTSRLSRFLFGAISGFVALSALLLVMWKAGLLAMDGQRLHGGSIVAFGLGWGLMFLIVAVFEESTLRGYLQFTLTRGMGFWWGALLLSLMFGAIHRANAGESPVGLFSAALIGLVFCLSLWYTGSLWWALGFHASWDWGESYFYGTSDSGIVVRGHLLSTHPVGSLIWSGGGTGPEGSVLVLPLLAVIVAVMILWWGPRAETPFRGNGWKPGWSRSRFEGIGLTAGPSGRDDNSVA
jgi:uncharacterized protein